MADRTRVKGAWRGRVNLWLQAKGLILSVCALLLLATTGCQESSRQDEDAPEVWRFALEESEGSVQHAYALRFKELIEERSEGNTKVVIYPYGPLGTSTQITEQLNLGVIEFAMASPGSLGKFIPELQVFLLHFLLPENEHQTRKLLSDAALVGYFDKLYAPKGLQLLSIFSEGEMAWTMKKEVRSPNDFRGIKMRVMTSPLLLAAYQAYGASPTPMQYSEVYSALQLNMIDGQVNPIFAIERQKFHEVTSHLIFPGHASFVTTCAANRQFFNNLSSEQQAIVNSVIAELEDYIFQVQTRLQQERLKAILRDKKRQQSPLFVYGEASGFSESLSDEERRELVDDNSFVTFLPGLSSHERQQFRQASQAVRDVYLEIGGPQSHEVLQLLQAAADD